MCDGERMLKIGQHMTGYGQEWRLFWHMVTSLRVFCAIVYFDRWQALGVCCDAIHRQSTGQSTVCMLCAFTFPVSIHIQRVCTNMSVEIVTSLCRLHWYHCRWLCSWSEFIIRPHPSTMYADAAYCYRPSSVVCRSIGRSVTVVSPAITAERIEMPFGLRTRVGWRTTY